MNGGKIQDLNHNATGRNAGFDGGKIRWATPFLTYVSQMIFCYLPLLWPEVAQLVKQKIPQKRAWF